MQLANLTLHPLVYQVLAALPGDVPVALAGGAVRDMLLGRVPHDYDFLVPSGAMHIARKLADRLGAAYFPLDEQRDYARLVWQRDARILLDFSSYRGPDLLADLQGRDVTINAIAIDLRAPLKLIDPTGGVNDLLARHIRPCSPGAFQTDPVRVLRAVRMAHALESRLLPETLRLMREAAPLVSSTSPERLRDELFKILDLRQAASAVRILDAIGVLPYVLPELLPMKGLQQSPPHIHEAFEHTLDVVSQLQTILDQLSPVYNEEGAGSLVLGLMVVRLGRYRSQLSEHLAVQLNPDRSLRALLNLAALYHDTGKPQTRSVEADGRVRYFEHEQVSAALAQQRAQGLRLSGPETERLRTVVHNHMRPPWLAYEGRAPSRRSIYHFFKATREAGVEVCLLALADTLATYGPTLPQEKWAVLLDVVRALLENWWERPQEAVAPPALVNGHDVMQLLSLTPGPRVGQVLEAIREAQASGQITSRVEALEFARNYGA